MAVSFIGEGAANQGAFHETLNLAALWKLPVIFVIEDNSWGVSVSKAASTAVATNDVRGAAYGIPGILVKDNDPIKVFEAAGEAIARARAGGGPTLIEIETDRLAGHFMGDTEGYRPTEERSKAHARDPIPRLKAQLIASGALTEAQAKAIDDSASSKVADAVAFARKSLEPQASALMDKLFA